MRAGKSSRAESAAAIFGFIILSALIIVVLDTSSLVNPTAPRNAGPASSAPAIAPPPSPPDGTLVVSVISNLNTTDGFVSPMNVSSGVKGVPVIATYAGSIPPTQERHLWFTNGLGLTGCIQCLPAGPYVVSVQYDGLKVTVPAGVFAGNQTTVQVSITGKAYHLAYSKESGVLVTPSSALYTMFAQVISSAPVANSSQPVFLNVLQGASGVSGYSINATAISLGAPTVGTQWLQLGTPSPVDLVGATSISMTAWSSSTVTVVGPVTYSEGLLKP